MKRHLSLVLASALPIAIFPFFVPQPYNQLDFIGLWVIAMIILALPMVYAEVALSVRSNSMPMQGIQKLTREADVSTQWRAFVWSNILLMALIAVLLVNKSAASLHPFLTTNVGMDVPQFVLPFILIVCASIMSIWGLKIALVGIGLLLVAALSRVDTSHTLSLQMTDVSFHEWGRATLLALVSIGAGTGIYWFANDGRNNSSPKTKEPATKTVLPIWIVQVIAGVLSFGLLAVGSATTVGTPVISQICTAVGTLVIAAVLLHVTVQLLAEQFGMLKALPMVIITALILTAIPHAIVLKLVVILTVITVAVFSIFAGWKMKISHLRKSLNFSSELKYNLWRVAVRILVPVSLAIGLFGWVSVWF